MSTGEMTSVEAGEAGIRNRAHLGVYRKGVRAFEEGVPICECPYEDKRARYGKFVTFSRAYIHLWREGWQAADADSEERVEG